MEDARLTIGSIRGIAIRIHRSWAVIAVLIAWSFYSRYAPDERGVAVTLLMAAVGSVLFFSSVLVHELAHSLEAQHRGVEVRGITLFLFGGATETRFEVERPRDEFALTAVGPFSSFVLAAVFGLVAFYASRVGFEAVADVSGTLGWVNVSLGVFNLLPGAPLDGGRILRSAVWAVTGDRGRSIRVAARVGQALGYGIIGLGLLQLFLVPGGFFGGIWFMFIGWFLSAAAVSELVQHQLSTLLRGLTVDDMVDDAPLPAIDADATLEQAAGELRRRPQDVLMVHRGDEPVGLLGLDDVAAVPGDMRAQRVAGDEVTPLDDLPHVSAGTEVADVVEESGLSEPVVVTATSPGGGDDQVRGVVTPDQIRRLVTRTLQLGRRPSPRARRPRSHLPARRSS